MPERQRPHQPGCGRSIGDHVFPTMREAGLLATLNTDDPALVGLDLTQEYELCAAAFGYGADDMVEISLDGIAGSWLDDTEAAVLSDEVRAFPRRFNRAPALRTVR